MKKALVTGGCGFIGSNLAVRLADANYDVTVVDNLTGHRPDYLEVFSDKTIEIVPSCFSSNEILERIENKEFDFVFHNAAFSAGIVSDHIFSRS